MRLYVGSLPNGYRLSELLQLFEQYGCVSRVTAIRDFAFLAIYDNEAAQAAVNALSGSTFMNQEIVVERARFPRTRFQNNRRFGRDGQQQGEGEEGGAGSGQNYDGAYQQPGRQYVQQSVQPTVYNQQGLVYAPESNGYQGDTGTSANNNTEWDNNGQNFQGSNIPSGRGRRGRRGGRGGNQQYRNNSDNQEDYQQEQMSPGNYQNQSFNQNDTNQQYPSNQQNQSNFPGSSRGFRGGRRGRGRRGGGRGGALRGSSSALQASELETTGAGSNGAVMEKVGLSNLDGGDRVKMAPAGGTVQAGGPQFIRAPAAVVVGGVEPGKLGRGAGDM